MNYFITSILNYIRNFSFMCLKNCLLNLPYKIVEVQKHVKRHSSNPFLLHSIFYFLPKCSHFYQMKYTWKSLFLPILQCRSTKFKTLAIFFCYFYDAESRPFMQCTKSRLIFLHLRICLFTICLGFDTERVISMVIEKSYTLERGGQKEKFAKSVKIHFSAMRYVFLNYKWRIPK